MTGHDVDWWSIVSRSAGEEATRRVASSPALRDTIASLIEEAIVQWPAFKPGVPALAKAVGEHIRHLPEHTTLEAWCDEVRMADFYLAMCCGLGDVDAIAAFESLYARDFERATKRFGGQRYHADDLHQILLEKLFVGPNAKIRQYKGKGHLQNWLRVTATHTFIDVVRGGAQRKRERLVEQESLEDALLADTVAQDVELQFLKAEYRAAFKKAFALALVELEASHRTILRQHLVERMSIDQLATVYGSHRSSAARWLSTAREALMMKTREQLMSELEISVHEVDSIIALIQSRFEVSMTRLLEQDWS